MAAHLILGWIVCGIQAWPLWARFYLAVQVMLVAVYLIRNLDPAADRAVLSGGA